MKQHNIKHAIKTVTLAVLIAQLLLLRLPWQAVADIYMYRDKDGVMHFTNVPNSARYKVYIKEGSRKKIKRFKGYGRYDSIISVASRRYGVESNLIKAIIKAESDFNPRAVSKKGAKGLMQIMPENYRDLGIINPFDPRQNIMGGTKYFRRMYNKYKKTSLALAAYNAGPTAVDKHKGVPPYKETKAYIKKVMKYYRQYS